LESIYVIGGGSKNKYWINILANILNRDLLVTQASDTMAAFGAARLAFLGFNNFKPEDVLSPPLVEKTISIDSNLTAVLQERFKLWKKFYVI